MNLGDRFDRWFWKPWGAKKRRGLIVDLVCGGVMACVGAWMRDAVVIGLGLFVIAVSALVLWHWARAVEIVNQGAEAYWGARNENEE